MSKSSEVGLNICGYSCSLKERDRRGVNGAQSAASLFLLLCLMSMFRVRSGSMNKSSNNLFSCFQYLWTVSASCRATERNMGKKMVGGSDMENKL